MLALSSYEEAASFREALSSLKEQGVIVKIVYDEVMQPKFS